MQENLVIVESPAKAKTIERFLGKDYKVMSSYGHIRDLKKKEISIDMNSLEPVYEIPEEKKKVVPFDEMFIKSRAGVGSAKTSDIKSKFSPDTNKNDFCPLYGGLEREIRFVYRANTK